MDLVDRDLAFAAGKFLDEPLPKEKQYIYQYFTTDVQKTFAKYYFDFRQWHHFVEHTGLSRTVRWTKKMAHRFRLLEQVYEKAKSEGDFETITEITMGKWKPKEGFRKNELKC